MIVDLHSHTYFSACGKDEPEELIKTMIENGVQVFGISDHNYGVSRWQGNRIKQYFDIQTALRDKYKDKMTIYRGIEIATLPDYTLFDGEDFSHVDYCLIEHIDMPESVTGGDVVSFAKNTKIKNCGIAHTDIFSFAKNKGLGEEKFIKTLAENGLFWELNMSYDSVHSFREHEYVKIFMQNKNQQDIVRKYGLKISVGFDGHRMNEYRVDRIKSACDFVEQNGLKLVTKFDNL